MRTLPAGIFYDVGERAGDAFGILFLRATEGATAAGVGAALRELWDTYRDLAAGIVAELPDHVVAHGNLTALLGYGVKAFELPGAGVQAPEGLGDRFRFRSPRPGVREPLLRGAGLHYGESVAANPATEEVAVQLVADTELAVHRAVVETWRVLRRHAGLELAAFFRGFQRDDSRSWIGFHDGISNLRSGPERAGVITIKPENAPAAAEAWTVGGTYLAFVRLAVDLAAWDALPREDQERLVGRDKLSGASLARVGADGALERVPGCPVAGTRTVVDPGNEEFREPPAVVEPLLRATHVQRANQHRRATAQPNSLRIYRQGYEFLDLAADGLVVGLNFVSFQDTLERLTELLTQDGWLGDTNFGGGAEGVPDPEILSVLAAGVYLVPPVREDGGLPGSELFG